MLAIESRLDESLEDYLEKEYITKYKPIKAIADELDVSRESVKRFLQLFDIPTRSSQEARLLQGTRIPSKEELEEVYNARESLFDVASKYNISKATALRWLNKKGIARKRRRPKGYLRDLENIKKELLKIVDALGYFPSTTDLIKLNESSIISVLKSIEVSLPSIRMEMGFTYHNREYRKKAADMILKRTGKTPRQLTVDDFGKIQIFGKKSSIDLLNWYRNRVGIMRFEYKPAYARDLLVADLYPGATIKEEQQLEALVRRYVGE